jgi:hypothetical protein
MNKQGQVTIFIILAILIVGGVIAYFSLRDYVFVERIPQNMQPVYDYYLSCLEATTEEGIHLLGEQGGYIEVPEFVPGSQYMPFSSQLDFLGQPVPYWMYVSGNNLLKEQVPKKSDMEQQLEDYVEERINDCDFSDFELQGYDVYIGEGEINIGINNLDVEMAGSNSVTIFFGEESVVVNDHEVSIDSKLGKFYDLAMKVYDFEKENMFLEQYALDVMRLYAPVTGSEISCSPKVFVDSEIREGLYDALGANIPALKLEGSYYELSSRDSEYFVTDIGESIDENVNFIYSPDWPTRIEIYGEKVVRPVGLQEGLGILGFCYVPYHLVYDIDFPVLVQFYDEEELFQFPMAVIIDNNRAREALPTVAGNSIESPVCEYKSQSVEIHTSDLELNPVEARIQFKCLNSHCDIGETKIVEGESVLDAQLPQCVNGFIFASSEGFADTKYQISTNEEEMANIILFRKHNISLDLGNVEMALVSFDGEDYSATAMYPEMDSIELIEGFYNVSVYAYKNSSLKFPAINRRECVDTPQSGIGGVFGLQEEKCFDINLPEAEVGFAIVGGGKTTEYFTEDLLTDSRELNINVPLFGVPANFDELQENQIKAEGEIIYLDFE